MAKIIQFDPQRKKPEPVSSEKKHICEHKHVVASTVFRTVRCSICNTELDPFDVLVEMLKAYVPPDDPEREQKRLLQELARRARQRRGPVTLQGK